MGLRRRTAREGVGQGMGAQMGGQLGEAAVRPFAEMMFDAFNVREVVTRVKAHVGEEFGEHGVTFADFFGDPAAFRGKREAAVGFVAEETQFAEPLDHDRGAGAVQSQGFSDIRDASVALAVFQVGDAFEVILHAFGDGGPIVSASLANDLFARGCGGFHTRPGHAGKPYFKGQEV